MSARRSRVPRQSAGQIFRIPVLIAVASLVGLILGLTGEGWRDWAAWGLLFIPIAVGAQAWRRRTGFSRERSTP